MIRKTMRVGDVRTSIKLEAEFWTYLKELGDQRGIRLSALVNEVADARPDRTNLASTLRTYCLMHAKLRCQTLHRDLDKLALAGNTQDLARVLEACPMPTIILDGDRVVRQLNRAFALWLNLDPRGTIGKRLDTIMILRGNNMREMWSGLSDGRLPRSTFNATYVSPGRVRTAQAVSVALGATGQGAQPNRPFIVMFETLANRAMPTGHVSREASNDGYFPATL